MRTTRWRIGTEGTIFGSNSFSRVATNQSAEHASRS
jgi:hypothetical protein